VALCADDKSDTHLFQDTPPGFTKEQDKLERFFNLLKNRNGEDVVPFLHPAVGEKIMRLCMWRFLTYLSETWFRKLHSSILQL
jgi:hypothetical protein